LPGILALHDHGHFKFFGKEKIALARLKCVRSFVIDGELVACNNAGLPDFYRLGGGRTGDPRTLERRDGQGRPWHQDAHQIMTLALAEIDDDDDGNGVDVSAA
jgi:hypothetical protein